MPFFSSLGFGYVEVGSITAKASKGNPQPRLFRLAEDEALINRMGLNNLGAEEIFKRFEENIMDFPVNYPVGINIAKTHDPEIMGEKAIEDILFSYKKCKDMGDYVTINISCPNTKEGKTFEQTSALKELLTELRKVKSDNPLLLKVSPDLNRSNIEEIIQIGSDYEINGYVISNTSPNRAGLKTLVNRIEEIGKGGLSGQPVRERSTDLISLVYNLTSGKKTIIGVGGVNSAESAYQKIKAGASLVQLYTGLIYEGPGLVKEINEGLVHLLERDGYGNISEAVGSGSKREC